MTCESFRESVRAGADDAAVREHLRACDACLEYAVSIDADVLFRSLGVPAAEPPGGTDAFVGDVMQQVHIREAERRLAPSMRISRFARWSAAAALGVAVIGGSILYRSPAPVIQQPSARIAAAAPMDRPVIESYDSPGAMIVEMPAESTDDIRLVMVFDESLPADL